MGGEEKIEKDGGEREYPPHVRAAIEKDKKEDKEKGKEIKYGVAAIVSLAREKLEDKKFNTFIQQLENLLSG